MGLIATLQDIDRMASGVHSTNPEAAHDLMRCVAAMGVLVDQLTDEAVNIHEQMVGFSEALAKSI
jgi:hypothetical protein